MDKIAAPSPLLLVSQSPRRRRLLGWLGLEFDSSSVDTPESLDTPLAAYPDRLAISLALEKASAAHDVCHWRERTILCFDTIVVLDGDVLGKPFDDEDARRMLRTLSGRTHQVVTGMAAWFPGDLLPISSSVVTNVTMNVLDERALDAWLARGEHLGCAGSYNIEGQVASVDDGECFQNVAGLPLCHLYLLLVDRMGENAGITRPCAQCDQALARSCKLGPLLLRAR